MEISSEEANFVKISKAILDFVPKYLLQCFIKIWNEKYQNRKWQSDNESGEFLVSELTDRIKNDKRNKIYIDHLKNLSEKQWDTTTLVFAMLYSGLSLTEPCRRQGQRKEPLRISEAIDVIRKARNTYFAHAERMACPSDEFERVMKDIKNAARYLADDAEREIEELIKSQIKMMTEEQMKQVREEKSRQPDLEIFLSICNEIRDNINDLKHDVKSIKVKLNVEDQPDYEEFIAERSKFNRNRLCKDLELWNIRLINTKEDGKLFVWSEGKREEYTAELSLFQTKTQSQAMPDEMRMFRNKPKAEESRVHYHELITAENRKCFLRGVAGIGKTSLVEYFALKWAKREMFLDKNGKDLFDFLFLVKCRELKEKSDETIEDFFKRKFDVDPDKLKDHGERVLIIVDGIDEEEKLEKSINTDTKLQALLKRDHEFLKGHATIVSGRPHIEFVLNLVQDQVGDYNKIEVAGLSPTEIDKHIDVIANDNKAAAAMIKEAIKSSTNMSELSAIPQYLATLCCIISMQGEGTKFNTEMMTPLHVWTLASFWTQHVQDRGQHGKGFYEKFSDKKVAQLYIKISMISFELLMQKKIVFDEEDFPEIREISEEHQEIFYTFFIKNHSHTKPFYQFEHLTLHEFFAATYCMLSRTKIVEVLDLEWYEVVRFIGGFIAAKESQDKRNIVKVYINCLENAKEEEEKSIDAVTFFNSVLEHFKNKSEFAQHYSLSLFHEMFENASGEIHRSLADLKIDTIPRFQDVLGEPAFVYYAMSQIELSDLVHFIESLFSNGFQHKLQEITVRIRFSSLKHEATIKKLFKSLLHFKNVWFTGCDFVSFPWEMINESGSSPVESKLEHLYVEGCNMSEMEFNELARVIPFAEKVELIYLRLSDANCQEMFDVIKKEHRKKRAKLRELRMVHCEVKDKFIYDFKSLKNMDAHFFK